MAYELTLNQTILRGDSWAGISFTVNKTGFDFTGSTIKAQFRTDPDAVVMLTKTITPTSESEGSISFDFDLTAEETKLLNRSSARTDIEITTGEIVFTPILIIFKITNDITK
jgi:hypothetical protein